MTRSKFRRAETQDYIVANLPVVAAPTVPEIRLHRAGPKSGLWRLAHGDSDFGSPYWAHVWGGGLALARYILDKPDVVKGRRVLDLGTGSGIVGIAAAKAGAAEVIAADVDPYAIAAVELNAAINHVAISPIVADLTVAEAPKVDVVCVGDLFYDAALAARVLAFLDRCLLQGAEILIGDPWRTHLPRQRLQLLAEYSVPDFGDADGTKASAVFALAKTDGSGDAGSLD